MKKSTKIFLLIVFIFIVAVALRLTVFTPVVKRPSMRGAVGKVTVKVTQAQRQDLNLILSYVGSLKATDEVNVFSKVSGKLVRYCVSEGDSIQKGEVIALVDRDETGLKYELAKVESPIAGILGKTLLDKGANILPSSAGGSTALAIVVSMDAMVVKLNITEADIPYLKKGLKAEVSVDAYPESIFEGEISKVSEVVDPTARTLPVEVTIANQDHKLKSGMFARIKIIVSKRQNLLVLPQDALIQELGSNHIFVVDDHTAKRRRVTTGMREDSHIEILEGLQEGEYVIVFGQQGLRDGADVEIVKE